MVELIDHKSLVENGDSLVIYVWISRNGQWNSFSPRFDWRLWDRIAMKNLPLPCWKCCTFEAIGNYFGGLVTISSQTLNFLDCSATYIDVEKNLCGFISATILIKSPKRGDFFLRFDDITPFDPPNIISRELHFSNSSDLNKIYQILKDEEIIPPSKKGSLFPFISYPLFYSRKKGLLFIPCMLWAKLFEFSFNWAFSPSSLPILLKKNNQVFTSLDRYICLTREVSSLDKRPYASW